MWATSRRPEALDNRDAIADPFALPRVAPPPRGAFRPSLARQLTIAFLVVTLPGTIALGALTLLSLRSVARVNGQLSEITQSLAATQEVQLAMARAEKTLGGYVLSGDATSRREFDRLIEMAELQTRSCGASACHGPTRTPDQMAAVLTAFIDKIKAESRTIFEGIREGHRDVDLARIAVVRGLISDANRRIHRMSGDLLVRVSNLGREAEEVSRHASLMIVSLTIAVALGACGAAIALAGRLSHPLRDLLLGTRRVMAGDWKYHVRVGDRGEIGELASSFNAMVEELARYRERVEEYNRTLEERVRERSEELKRKVEALRQSERLASLGQLAAGVAHELNNPLTSIVMNANLLIEEVGVSSPLHDDLRRIDEDAGRCRRIIEDLRVFARRRELMLVPSRVARAVEQALRSVRHELEGRGIQTEVDVPADVPDVVWDPDRMVQVLTNVVANAAQAIGTGGRITLSSRRDDGCLVVEVRDTGPGIPAEHRQRIFDPFFTTKPDGTGLGLSISHGIVNEHGGRIEVETHTREDGVADGETGTTVRIIVPIVETTA
jgi:signal transduction histidine kinase